MLMYRSVTLAFILLQTRCNLSMQDYYKAIIVAVGCHVIQISNYSWQYQEISRWLDHVMSNQVAWMQLEVELKLAACLSLKITYMFFFLKKSDWLFTLTHKCSNSINLRLAFHVMFRRLNHVQTWDTGDLRFIDAVHSHLPKTITSAGDKSLL